MHYDAFIKYLQYEKRMSPHTVLSYSNDLQQFQTYLDAIYKVSDIREVNHSIIRSWIVSLMDNKLSSRSVNRKISTLKSFYKYLLREKVVSINPMGKIQSPKNPKRLPIFIEESKMEAISTGEIYGEGFKGARDMLLIEVLYATGMRRAELINLKIRDIDLAKGTLKVLGKRNKERLIPVTTNLAGLIREYLDLRRKLDTSGNDHLFINEKGNPLNPSSVYRSVRDTLKKVTTLSKKSPHVLRHTFATHLLNNGANLNAIKELLGHANLAATQVYTHNTIEKLKNVYSKSHPRA